MVLTGDNVAELAALAGGADVVIDAVLGTGAEGGLRGPPPSWWRPWTVRPRTVSRPCGPARARAALVVACDVPSGVDADTGEAPAPVLAADMTVTFGAAKAGLLADPGADFAGRIRVIPIGIEEALPWPALRRLEAGDLSALLPRPQRRAHKYSRGVLGVVAGSAPIPAPPCWPARAPWPPASGWSATLGRRRSPTSSASHCPEVVCSAGTVADAHVQAWLVGSGTG